MMGIGVLFMFAPVVLVIVLILVVAGKFNNNGK